nr:MD [synthetic construct]
MHRHQGPIFDTRPSPFNPNQPRPGPIYGGGGGSDCLSGRYKGPCAVWDNETCRRVCKEEGRSSGHCSPSLKCWCEGC